MKKLLKKKLKKYIVEVFLISIAIFIALISAFLYFQNLKNENVQYEIEKQQTDNKQENNFIYVEVSGSVKKPDVYKVVFGTRLNDLIKKAGGLSDEADKNYFARNFNLARIVFDQEKIYIPSVWEVNNGYFIESVKNLTYQQLTYQNPNNNQSNELININEATLEELDSLPGIGKVTAQKIIDARPFNDVNDLVNKKIVNKSVFEKIKDLITI